MAPRIRQDNLETSRRIPYYARHLEAHQEHL